MKQFGLFALTLVLLAAPAAAQTAGTAAIDRQLVANERAINDAFAKGDLKAFQALIIKDGMGIDPMMGVVGVSEMEKMIGQVKLTKWNIDMTHVFWLSPDVAMVMYRWTGNGTYQGQPLPSPTWSSTAWVKQADGRWLAKFHQETNAVPMPVPPAKK
jgi:ketosteroid isomerase-like protein